MDKISLNDPAFRYGLGVFETLIVKRGKALFWDWHLESLIKAVDALGLKKPEEEKIRQIPAGDGIWRWFVTEDRTFTQWGEGLEPLPESYELSLSPVSLSSVSWEARFKTLSYLSHLQARKQAAGDECVMLNEKGEVASASMANIFAFHNGVLRTPVSEAGCRQGVIRRWVFEHAPVEVKEGTFGVDLLDEAEALFLTNSRIGIMPVSKWRGTSKAIEAEIISNLRSAYELWVMGKQAG